MTQNNTETQQDLEMLDEYDFKGGVRGKYYQRYQNNNLQPLRGIQFIIDYKGCKKGVLIDLNEHQNLWNRYFTTYNSSESIHYLINHQGEKIAVFLNFNEQLLIWQLIYDDLISELID